MAQCKYQRELGATAACVLHMGFATKGCGQEESERKQDIFVADSWFASVNSTEQLRKHGMDLIGNCKTEHKFSPTRVSCDVHRGLASYSINPSQPLLSCLIILSYTGNSWYYERLASWDTPCFPVF